MSGIYFSRRLQTYHRTGVTKHTVKPKMTKSRFYLAYFDTLGFECVLDLTDIDRRMMWASLSDKHMPNEIPLHQMVMRARFNPQRFPEIWTFQSELDLDTILRYTSSMPQEMANLIREHGDIVYVTKRNKEVIR